jgi:prepilin-type processing-associated H-X9-DG protein
MFRSYRILFVFTVLCLSICSVKTNLVIAANSPVENMVKVLPDGVLLFYATSGGDSLKPAFEKAVLGRVWNDPGVQTFYGSVKEQLLSKIAQEMHDPNEAKAVDIVQSFAKSALSRPIIVGAAQKEAAEGQPPVYGFAILDAGPRKEEIAAALTELESLAGEGDITDVNIGTAKMHGPKDCGDVPGYWGWVENYLVFAINDGDGLAMKYLSKSRFIPPDYLKKVRGSGDAIAMYADCQKIAGIVSAVAQQEVEAAEILNLAEGVISGLGLNNVKAIKERVGFAGSDLVGNCFLEMPAPRTGLLAQFKTIDMKIFDMVDVNAMSTTAINCDIAGIYDTAMKAAKAADGDDFEDIEETINEIEEELNFKIRQGLLESLSGEIVFYILPGGIMPQSPQGGQVIIAKLKDAKRWEETSAALVKFAAEKSDGMVQVSSQVQEDRTIHTLAIMPLAMMQVMPSWTVMGDKVVIGSNPTLLNMAVKQINSGRKSIRTTEGFKNAAANLPDNLISLKYSDTKVQFNQMMTGLQQVWPMATMAAAKAGLTLPFVLPNLSHIAEDMKPSCQYSWYDEQGLYSHYRGTGIEPSIGALGGGALGLGIMMPALARTRNQTHRIISATNLSAIGKTMMIYANDYDDKFPPNLQELIDKCELSPKTLESKRKPRYFTGPSYIYIAGQNISMHPGNITVYENPAYCSEGINVLFLDGHVQWMKRDDFLRDLKATYTRLGKEMPEIKFKDSDDTTEPVELIEIPVNIEK